VLAVCAAEEPFRLRTVELDALAPMIKQVCTPFCAFSKPFFCVVSLVV
jgi:hypothetical protein